MKKNMSYSLKYLLISFASILVISCNSKEHQSTCLNNQILENDSIPQVVKNVFMAVYDNDSMRFANEISYPLLRPYPLKDIQNVEEMAAYYSIIMDDSLRSVIINSKPEDWQEFGWRGYSLKDGAYLWIDDSIYAVNYLSKREKSLIDSLCNIEIKSLPRNLREGWIPELTLSSKDNTIFRIDKKTEGKDIPAPEYRLLVYNNYKNKKDLSKTPDLKLSGYQRIDGSAAIVSYVFRDKEGKDYIIYPDDPSTGTPTVNFPDSAEQELKKTYWHELITN